MVRITKVHTGAGDGGKTRLLDGTEVGKEDPRVRLYGTIDEVNSQLGVVRMELNRMPGVPVEAEAQAEEVHPHEGEGGHHEQDEPRGVPHRTERRCRPAQPGREGEGGPHHVFQH